jgi:cyclopropane-fatty-acyl-phospholipid synthase
VSNEFYRLVLGPTMAYSCAVFEHETDSLETAQANKFELVCRKLGLSPGMRLLDIGCGWGGMVLHAAARHGVEAVGVTVSVPQAEHAEKRVADAGLGDRVEIRVQDYRDIGDGPFDAISSIGMFEHVGASQLSAYFSRVADLLGAQGRLVNHAISRPTPDGRPRLHRRGFYDRYIFPDGELHEVGQVVSGIQDAGLEVRDVEGLREQYARTLRRWVSNLEANWDRAVEEAGLTRARIWRLYLAVSAVMFEDNRIHVDQVLAVNTPASGSSGFPLRPDWTEHLGADAR